MKRLLSIILTLTLCLGLAVSASAASTISGIKLSLDTNNKLSEDSFQPGQEFKFPITANMFEWSDGVAGVANAPVTKAQLRSGSIDVRSSGVDNALVKTLDIKEATFAASGNVKTAYVHLVLKDDNISTSTKDFRFTVHLTYKGSRIEGSKVVVEGTLSNKTKTVTADNDYVDISKGEVLEPKEYIKSIDIDIGAGVQIRTRVYSDKRYYGTASEGILSEDDKVVEKYPSISHILRLKTTNLKSSGNIVMLDYNNFYVYDIDGKYLGNSDDLIPYSDKYYLFKTKVDMGSGTGSSSSSSSSSSSTTTTSSATSSSATVVSGAAITKDAAVKAAQTAVATAKSKGQKATTILFRDYGSISADALKSASQTGKNSGIGVSLYADTMNGNSVAGRLIINTASAANLKSDTKLGVRLDANSTSATKQRFNRWFNNKLAIVSLDQKNSFGMTVKIAAKVDISGMSTNNLKFYSYNSSKNEYALIANPLYSVDANGYLHFSTVSGGEIIISDGALSKG